MQLHHVPLLKFIPCPHDPKFDILKECSFVFEKECRALNILHLSYITYVIIISSALLLATYMTVS